MGKRATIRDVAERAGVSKSTVSLVLHDSPLVRAETKAAVADAIRELNYVRNRAAAALRSANSGRIGIVVNDLATPFVTDFVVAAQAALMRRGLAPIVGSAGEDAETEDRAVRLALEHDIAGLLIAPCHGAGLPVFDTILAAGIPAMQVLRQSDDRLDRLPFHSMDYAIGSHLAAQHLLDQGLRRIAFVGGHSGHQIAWERASGYRDIMQVHGQRPLVIEGDASRDFGRAAMARIAREHPEAEAAICIDDRVALGMLGAAGAARRTVGRDFWIVGFDDIPECATADPPLSSVHCDVARLAERSVAALLGWIDTGNRPDEFTREPVQLKVRASSTVA
ncbi:LacI family DNA-binding transcriptional regulator [Psychromarinibacter sp. C21-152]|uniref:LacI family DNA-binding transcriptional regulator n=1 Tax=Psychromarinibacter sediminicola TaxID=3033385 RepID=A0AAE3NWI8_9RHOB|nr:LacI family DNA-binding transcriptional regulator [Psychromarinibacter sediminicola]MDF0601937.1 LacI family DNA-binding transcriptional regulator [Psychromarinibacter sediminicola]